MKYFGYMVWLVLALSALFGIFSWFHLPFLLFRDICVGVISCFWLVGITIIPWNIYFTRRARFSKSP